MKGIQGHNESGESSVENSPKHFDSVLIHCQTFFQTHSLGQDRPTSY